MFKSLEGRDLTAQEATIIQQRVRVKEGELVLLLRCAWCADDISVRARKPRPPFRPSPAGRTHHRAIDYKTEHQNS